MFTDEFFERQRKLLLNRKKKKEEILDAGGQQALLHSLKDVERIIFALRRLEDGQYGICAQCGTLIEPGRLEFMPETPLCSSCANLSAH